MKVTLIKDHNYSLDGRSNVSGKKGDRIEVTEETATKWKGKGVIAASKAVKPVVETKPVPVPENKMDKQEDKETKEVEVKTTAPKRGRRKKATK